MLSQKTATLLGRALCDQNAGAEVANVLNNLTQGAALTAQETTITHTAPETADYAIQDFTQTTPFGFVTADEANTVLKVIANLQVRLAEVEARLEAAGIVAAN